MNFSELVQTALLGTERQGLSLTAGNPQLGGLLGQLDLSRREDTFLAAAAVIGLHVEIGRLPGRDLAPGPAACETEARPYMNARAGSFLLRLLAGEFPELLPECLALVAGAGQLAFPEALPGLLGVGLAQAEWREAILPVLGERGRWLAAQNPEWSWAVGGADDDENIWHVGDGAARLSFLRRLRRTNPTRARELLAATWKDEDPEDRIRFVSILESGLNADDEPLLEAALDDKRKEVRKGAATLLARLPGSALITRMIGRATPLLKFTPAQSGSLLKFQKSKPAILEIVLPSECDKSMQRDGIEIKPMTGFGEKIGWIIQMLETVPLTYWTTTWKTSPAEVIEASMQGEWKKEMFEAWLRAAIRQENQDWAEAVFPIALTAKRVEKFDGLLAALSVERREVRLAALLESDDATTRDLQGNLVAQCRHAWSPELSRTVLSWLRKLTAQPSNDWPLRSQLKDFATRLAVPVFNEAQAGWPTDSASWEFWSKGVDEFLALAQFRSNLHAAFSTPSPTAS
jgi:hypothetical protein